MTGPTSEAIGHEARLVEVHTITVPSATIGMDAAIAMCKATAEDWLDAHGLGASITTVARSDGHHGVTFDVEVGRGDIALDQRVPGVLDSWRWSARWQWWRDLFNRADRRQGRLIARREDGLASVTRLHPGHLGEGRAQVGVTVAAEPGCVCHVGGPFRDICPVHYRPGSNT